MINITGDASALAAATEGDGGAALRSLVSGIPVGEVAAALAADQAAKAKLVSTEFRYRGFDREPLWVKEIREGDVLQTDVREALLIPTKVSNR